MKTLIVPVSGGKDSQVVLSLAKQTGRAHIESMVALEDQWKAQNNPRKFIKVHRVWDVRDFLENKDVRDLFGDECGYCSI